jgi:hypothetical protein
MEQDLPAGPGKELEKRQHSANSSRTREEGKQRSSSFQRFDNAAAFKKIEAQDFPGFLTVETLIPSIFLDSQQYIPASAGDLAKSYGKAA